MDGVLPLAEMRTQRFGNQFPNRAYDAKHTKTATVAAVTLTDASATDSPPNGIGAVIHVAEQVKCIAGWVGDAEHVGDKGVLSRVADGETDLPSSRDRAVARSIESARLQSGVAVSLARIQNALCQLRD